MRPTRLPAAACLALTLVACGADAPPVPPTGQPAAAAAEAAPPAERARLDRGIDVSRFSGAVDWQQVAAAGYSFAVVKATEGVDLEDPAFDENWRAKKEAGLVRGAYHFYVTEDDPQEQARFFLDTVTLEPGDLAPVVDVELIGRGTTPGLADRLRTFLGVLEAEIGVKPIVYTAPDFWEAHLTDDFGDYPLWVAEYGVDQPRLPKGWDRWHLWQWRQNGRVPGVEKDADLNRVNPELEDLSSLLVPH